MDTPSSERAVTFAAILGYLYNAGYYSLRLCRHGNLFLSFYKKVCEETQPVDVLANYGESGMYVTLEYLLDDLYIAESTHKQALIANEAAARDFNSVESALLKARQHLIAMPTPKVTEHPVSSLPSLQPPTTPSPLPTGTRVIVSSPYERLNGQQGVTSYFSGTHYVVDLTDKEGFADRLLLFPTDFEVITECPDCGVEVDLEIHNCPVNPRQAESSILNDMLNGGAE
jgi:hypothetical protein